MIQVVNKATGEIMEFSAGAPDEIMQAWLNLTETIKACERAKEKLKPLVRNILHADGTFDCGDYMFRLSVVQRQNYDKAVMRANLDADTFDLLLVPDKPRIDAFLQENLESLGEASTILRNSMVPVGEPYTTIRLEKVKGAAKNEMVGYKNRTPDLQPPDRKKVL